MSSGGNSSNEADLYHYFEVEGAVFREAKAGPIAMEVFVDAKRIWDTYTGDPYRVRRLSNALTLEEVLPYMEPKVARDARESNANSLTDKPTNIFSLHHRKHSSETIEILESLLNEAKRGEICGLALVVLRSNSSYDLKLRGEAAQVGNQMYVAGMLAALQKMALELDR